MKIAIVSNPLDFSTGGERHLLSAAIEFKKLGCDVEILTNRVSKNCFPHLVSQVKISIITPNFFLQKVGALGDFLKLSHSISKIPIISIGLKMKKKYDLIHSITPPSHWAAGIAKIRLDLPVVWLCNEPPLWYLRPDIRNKYGYAFEYVFFNTFDKYIVNKFEKIVVMTNKIMEKVKLLYRKPSTIVRCGVDIDFFVNRNKSKSRDYFGFKPDEFVILQVSTAAKYKVNTEAISSLECILKKYRNVKVVLVGYNVDLMFRGLKSRQTFHDKLFLFSGLTDNEIADLYTACDLFIFPIEITWGLAVIEAMASSTPVVVSDRAGVSEIIKQSKTGIVFKHDDNRMFVEWVEKIINDKNLREKIAENAKKYVIENLSWQKYAMEMLSIFKKCISENH